MSFSKIVGFGDSWMYGDELIEPQNQNHYSHPSNDAYRQSKCFLGLLGQHYNVPVENHGVSGGSLHSTVWKFLQWFEHEPQPQNSLILIGLTESDRFSYYNPTARWEKNRLVHSTWVDAEDEEVVPQEFKQLIKQQTVLTTCDSFSKLIYQQTVRMFDGMAARHQLNLHQFHISLPLEQINLPTLIWPEFSLNHWFVHTIQPKYGRKYIMPNGHPNELGHELVRDRLISHIDSCTMYEC